MKGLHGSTRKEEDSEQISFHLSNSQWYHTSHTLKGIFLFLQGSIKKFAKSLKQNWHQASMNRRTWGTELDGFACLRKMASRLGLCIVWNLSIKLLSNIRAYHQSQTIWLNNLRVAHGGRRWIYMWDMMSVS